MIVLNQSDLNAILMEIAPDINVLYPFCGNSRECHSNLLQLPNVYITLNSYFKKSPSFLTIGILFLNLLPSENSKRNLFFITSNRFFMKKLFFLFFLLPLLVQAQQTVVSVERLFPKVDKTEAFEKALANHAQKFHTGKYKWRVFQIQSGPDYGGYHITEGPVSWDEVDHRGDLGAEHMADWNKNIAPLLTERATSSFSVYQEELSNVALTDYSDWININHLQTAPGYGDEIRDLITKLKKGWVEDKSTVAVYSNSSSGAPGYAIVTRYKQGLKERTMGFRPPFKETYEKANGAGSWTAFQDMLKKCVASSSSELLKFRADLSSK